MRATRVLQAARAVTASAALSSPCASRLPWGSAQQTSVVSRSIHTRQNHKHRRGFHPLPLIVAVGPFWSAQQPTYAQSHAPANTASPNSAASQQDPSQPRYRLHRVVGDGACMFRAVVQGAQYNATGIVLERDEETKAALELRMACLSEMQKRRGDMEPFLAGIIEGYQDFDQYLRMMANPAAWGGEPEILMASHVLSRPITVFRPESGALEPIVTYNEELGKGKRSPISILWTGAHYDCLLPM